MTLLQRAMLEDPSLDPEMLILCSCPSDLGLRPVGRPEQCPDTELPCRFCWTREAKEELP